MSKNGYGGSWYNSGLPSTYFDFNMNRSKLQPPPEHVPASTTYFHSSNARSSTNFTLRHMKTFCKSNMNRQARACSSFNNLLMLAFLLYWCWFADIITNQSKIDIRSIQKIIISLIAFSLDLGVSTASGGEWRWFPDPSRWRSRLIWIQIRLDCGLFVGLFAIIYEAKLVS